MMIQHLDEVEKIVPSLMRFHFLIEEEAEIVQHIYQARGQWLKMVLICEHSAQWPLVSHSCQDCCSQK